MASKTKFSKLLHMIVQVTAFNKVAYIFLEDSNTNSYLISSYGGHNNDLIKKSISYVPKSVCMEN